MMRAPYTLMTAAFALAACTHDREQVHKDGTAIVAAPEPTTPRKVIFHKAPGGDVAKVVQTAMAQAKEDHRKLLVYIGATWCEPCQRFHHAAEQGELDPKFGDLTLIEFDLDADGQRLSSAGYSPQYIPYFGVPAETGRASGKGSSGSIKGPGAVDDLVPKLEALLAP